MIYRDIAGAILQEKDQVLFPLGLGTSVVATVQKTDNVLGANAQPMIHVALTLALPAMPNGLVGGVMKLPAQEPEKKIVE